MSLFQFVAALAVAAPTLAFVANDADEGKAPEARAARRVVVVSQDAKPFTVEPRQIVRLTAKSVAGSKIVAQVDGPAKVAAENSVLTVKDGHVLIGMERVEFVIKPTGKGTVTVKITTTFLNNPPTVKTYEFEVK
ncbi:MAG: hypothetical protein JW809_09765 [Pirellulales bacterium]|nr:hypothetical protein [Pirellulales bacterium]